MPAVIVVGVTPVIALAMPTATRSVVSTTDTTAGAAAKTCANVLFVGARGSGEKGPGDNGWKPTKSDPYGLGGTVDSAYHKMMSDLRGHRTVQAISVVYAANGVQTLVHAPNQYFHGLAKGVQWTLNALSVAANSCPDQEIVLAGFSQGAMVMHRVLHDLGDTAARRQILARVVAALLTGDGDEVPNDHQVRFGTAARNARGIGQALRTMSHASAAKFSNSLGPRVLSVCNKHDLVCGWTDFNLACLLKPWTCLISIPTMIKIHLSYSGSEPLRQAADRVAADIRIWPLPVPRDPVLVATAGKPFGYQFKADIEGGYGLQWAAKTKLPSGLVLSETGIVSGKPASAGRYTTVVQVRSARSGNYSPWVQEQVTFDVTKEPPGANLTWGKPTVIDNAQDMGPLSCATTTFCVDVGGDTGSVTMFDGTTWTDPGPIVTDGWLLAVSCPATTFCVAGGWNSSPAKPTADVVYYNGKSWSKPVDLAGSSMISALSCPSPDWCVAAAGSAVFTFNGTRWSSAAVAADDVESLSCVSATLCAAGETYGGLQYFNGSSWSTPFVADPNSADILSVSCSSVTYCLAVALWNQTTWVGNGTGWQAVTGTTTPYGGFSDVSCAGGTCDGVPNIDGGSGAYQYAGAGNWTAVQAVSTDKASALSCAAAAQCMAVGNIPDPGTPTLVVPAAFTLSGQTWPDAIPARGQVSGLSCPLSSLCMAGDDGFDYNGYGGPSAGNIITYNGTSWSAPAYIDYDPVSSGFTWSQGLTGISCASQAFCAAVDQFGYAFLWDGTNWTVGDALTSDTVISLTAVSCASANLCAAVAPDGTAYVFSGSTWTPAWIDPYSWQSGGNKRISGDTLLAVSCTTSATCVALDSDGYTFTYSGGAWTADAKLSGAGWTGLSCVPGGKCIAVGGIAYAALTGKTWSAPKQIDTTSLNAVSCVSSAFCEAVDASGDALTFNGSSWTSPGAALPGIPLTTVSCGSAGVCMATGVDPATRESEAITGLAS